MGDADVLRDGIDQLRVNEIFGPTLQGEGPNIGTRTWFIRMAGCDLRCSWCDTKYAWSEKAGTYMTEFQVMAALHGVPPGSHVCLTGGNPAMYNLSRLVRHLKSRDLVVSVETQGTLWPRWLGEVDSLVVSPKLGHAEDLVPHAYAHIHHMALKFVVFDLGDLDFAREVMCSIPRVPTFIQPGAEDGKVSLPSYQWLIQEVLKDPSLAHVRILPQLHVLIWGPRRGV